MEELTKYQTQTLNYIDRLEEESYEKKEIINSLIDNLGYNKKSASQIYITWIKLNPIKQDTGLDYKDIDLNQFDEDTIDSLLELIQLMEVSPKPENTFREIYDQHPDLIEMLYGDWFGIHCYGYRSNLPCIEWENDGIVLNVSSEDWEKYFSGLDEYQMYYYNYAYSSYGNNDEVFEDEFNYVYTNDETKLLFEKLAMMSGLLDYPGKDGESIEEGEVKEFLEDILPEEKVDRIISNYCQEFSYELSRCRTDAIQKEYEESKMFEVSDGNITTITIPYDKLIEIITEKNLETLSELRDAEIQDPIYLEGAWSDTWMDTEGSDKVINELNNSLEKIIEDYENSEEGLGEMLQKKKQFFKSIRYLGFSGGPTFVNKDNNISFNIKDVDLSQNKMKIIYNGKPTIILIDNLSDYVSGSTFDFGESVILSKKTISETINRVIIKKLKRNFI